MFMQVFTTVIHNTTVTKKRSPLLILSNFETRGSIPENPNSFHSIFSKDIDFIFQNTCLSRSVVFALGNGGCFLGQTSDDFISYQDQ